MKNHYTQIYNNNGSDKTVIEHFRIMFHVAESILKRQNLNRETKKNENLNSRNTGRVVVKGTTGS